MLHQYFQPKNTNPFTDSLERPIKEIMDLNMRTLQSFSYFTPTELLKLRKPEEVIEKNLEIMIENTQAAMTYMQNMFGLMEKHVLKNLDSTNKGTQDLSSLTKRTTTTAQSKPSTKNTASANKTNATTTKTTVAKSKTATAKSSRPTEKTTSLKKQPIKHTTATPNKSALNSTTANKATTITAGTKTVSPSSPQRLTTATTSAAPMKPMMKELETKITNNKLLK